MNFDPLWPGPLNHWLDRRPVLAVIVPEIDECIRELKRGRATHPQVRIAPLGRIQLANIESADEPNLMIDDQQLTVVARVAPRIEQVPDAVESAELQCVDRLRETFEPWRHNQIGEAVENNIDIDALGSLARQALLKCLANWIALPDERLEEDSLTHRRSPPAWRCTGPARRCRCARRCRRPRRSGGVGVVNRPAPHGVCVAR